MAELLDFRNSISYTMTADIARCGGDSAALFDTDSFPHSDAYRAFGILSVWWRPMKMPISPSSRLTTPQTSWQFMLRAERSLTRRFS